jgi:endonuclease YncB( thermonuclease family)
MKEIKAKSVIFLGIPLLFLLINGRFHLEKSISGICDEVLDGDTVIVNGHRIRLANLDAPESSQNSFDGVSIGSMSTKFLVQKIKGKRVVVTYKKRGRYGRIIGEIWKEGVLINDQILEEGMAISFGDQVSVEQRALEFTAKIKRKGIFKTIGFLRPSVYRSSKRRKISSI